MKYDVLSYKKLFVLLIGILRKEMSKEKFDSLLDLLCISYKMEVDKKWKK